jgi:hypothetical protein
VVPESRGTTTVVFFSGGGGLLLLMQPLSSAALTITLVRNFIFSPDTGAPVVDDGLILICPYRGFRRWRARDLVRSFLQADFPDPHACI